MENNTNDKIQLKDAKQFIYCSLEIEPLEHEVEGIFIYCFY